MPKLEFLLRLLNEPHREIVLVVGAGLSASNVRENSDRTGLPLWKDLARNMIDWIEEYFDTVDSGELDTLWREGNYQEIADRFKKLTKGTPAYGDFLKAQLDPGDLSKEGTDLHRLILNTGFFGVLTTNFDRVFECSRHGLDVLSYPTAFEVPGMFKRNFFVKIHGCITDKNPVKNLILATEDFAVLQKDERYKLSLASLYLNNIFLCVGYSFSDPDFKSLLETFKLIYKDNAQRPYLLLHKDIDRSQYNDDVHVIQYDKHSDIADIMQQIKAKLDKRKPPSTTVADVEKPEDAQTLPASDEQDISAQAIIPTRIDFEIPASMVFESARQLWRESTVADQLTEMAKSLGVLGEAITSKSSEDGKPVGELEVTELRDLPSAQLNKVVELESLYYFVASIVKNKSIYTPFHDLACMRASLFAQALVVGDQLSTESCNWIVKSVTDNMPKDGVAEYLKEINQEVNCTAETRLYWAAIIHQMLTRGQSVENAAIGELIIDDKFPELPDAKQRLLSQLESPEAIHRVHAAFQVLEWGFKSRGGGLREKIDYLDDILDRLANMVRSRSTADRIASVFALRWIVRAENVSKETRLRKNDEQALVEELLSNRNTNISLYNLILTISYVFEEKLTTVEIMRWISSMDKSLLRRPDSITKELPADLVPFFYGLYKSQLSNADPFWKAKVAFCMLRLNIWLDDMIPDLLALITNPNTEDKEVNEILLRLEHTAGEKAVPLLLKIVEYPNESFNNLYRCMALLQVIELGSGSKLNENNLALVCRLANLDAQAILAESSNLNKEENGN